MRKLLFPLLCLSLIFNSCEEDDSTTSASPSPSSTPCGSATLTANSSSYAYNNPHMEIPGECMVLSHVFQETSGDYSQVAVAMTNMYSNDWEVEWALTLNFSVFGTFPNLPPLNIGTAVTSGFYANFGLDTQTGGPQYLSNSSPNGEMTITNIDLANNTFDGNFSVTVYHTTMPPLLLNGSFSDIPFLYL